MKQNELKIGDKVRIFDDSYIVRVDRFWWVVPQVPLDAVYGVIAKTPTNYIAAGVEGARKGLTRDIHNIFIQNIETKETYLHSSAFVEKLPEKKVFVKKASEIVKWLEDNGYEYGATNLWGKVNQDTKKYEYIEYDIFRLAGKECNYAPGNMPREWLEEKEV